MIPTMETKRFQVPGGPALAYDEAGDECNPGRAPARAERRASTVV